MRIRVPAVACVLSLVLASQAFAQGYPMTTEAQREYDGAQVKMVAGWVMVGIGTTFVFTPSPGGYKALGAGLSGGGGYLIYLGAKQRRRALEMPRPSLHFGVSLHDTRGVFVKRTW